MANLIDLTGQRFGAWVVIQKSARPRRWSCQCGCGAIHDVRGDLLRDGLTTRCLACRKNKPLPEITCGYDPAANAGSIEKAKIEAAKQQAQIDWEIAYNNGGNFIDDKGVACVSMRSADGLYFIVCERDALRLSGRYIRSRKHQRSLTHYLQIRLGRGLKNSRQVRLHRFILGLESERLDHINMNGLDNRRSNLRPADHGSNCANTMIRSHNSSGYKGVRIENGRFMAQICTGGRNRRLGVFRSSVDAALAYDRAAKEFHGEFARVNFPDGAPL